MNASPPAARRHPVDPTRVRTLPPHFAWIDHRLRARLRELSLAEIAVLVFLHLAADRYGLSMARNAERPDPVAQVSALLEQLSLTPAARCLATVLAQVENTQPAYSDFLRQLLEIEQGARWERKLQRRRRWSKLGPPVSLDGFDWAARPQLP